MYCSLIKSYSNFRIKYLSVLAVVFWYYLYTIYYIIIIIIKYYLFY